MEGGGQGQRYTHLSLYVQGHRGWKGNYCSKHDGVVSVYRDHWALSKSPKSPRANPHFPMHTAAIPEPTWHPGFTFEEQPTTSSQQVCWLNMVISVLAHVADLS